MDELTQPAALATTSEEPPAILTAAGYRVQVDLFEGPLDLLLHLVQKNELDITEISLAEVAHQYWEYLQLMQALNLEIESSFILVLASLLEIKSRMLLPIQEPLPGEPPQTEEERSQDLIERLKVYKQFKEAALSLQGRETLSLARHTRPVDEAGQPVEEGLALGEVSVFDLLDAVQGILRRHLEQDARTIRLEKMQISVPERMKQVWRQVTHDRTVRFLDLFEDAPDRDGIIVTFLAILELARLRRIRLVQAGLAGDIMVTARDADRG